MNYSDETSAAERPPALEYPIVYRVVTWARVVVVSFCSIMAIGWTYLTLLPAPGHGQVVGICGVVLWWVGAAYAVAWSLTARITLYADRFEQSKPFIHRELSLDEIAGRRYTTGRGAGYPMIVPKSGRPFSIDTASYGLDERFKHWFLQLPDANEMEGAKYIERIRSDASLGATPDERVKSDAARKRNFMAAGGMLTFGAVALFDYSITMSGHLAAMLVGNAVLPWAVLALVALFKTQANDPGGKRYAFLAMPVLFPTVTLGMLATGHASLMHAKGVIVWGFVLGAIILLAGIAVYTKLRNTGSKLGYYWIVYILIIFPWIWVYAGSVLALANRTMDTAPPRNQLTRVTDKYITRSNGETRYYLQLAPTASHENLARVEAGAAEYRKTNKGNVVCVAYHPGALGYTWYSPCK